MDKLSKRIRVQQSHKLFLSADNPILFANKSRKSWTEKNQSRGVPLLSGHIKVIEFELLNISVPGNVSTYAPACF